MTIFKRRYDGGWIVLMMMMATLAVVIRRTSAFTAGVTGSNTLRRQRHSSSISRISSSPISSSSYPSFFGPHRRRRLPHDNNNINVGMDRSGSNVLLKSSMTTEFTVISLLSDGGTPGLPVEFFDVTPILVVGVALGLGITAQGFINQMLEGDQGLGAYLRDGSGYNKSGFRTKKQPTSQSKDGDPLPWLKLPQLDFVEVAGQPNRKSEMVLMNQLESLRVEMNTLLREGNIQEATRIREELETLMEESGIEYNDDS